MKSNVISFLVGIAVGIAGLIITVLISEEREKWG